jgi:endoglucanase
VNFLSSYSRHTHYRRLRPLIYSDAWWRISSYHLKKILITFTLFSALIVTGCIFALNNKYTFIYASPISTIEIMAISPLARATISGATNLRFTLKGATTYVYEPYWSVDNGPWHAMEHDTAHSNSNYAQVNVSTWKKSTNGVHAMRYMVRMKNNPQVLYDTFPVQVTDDTVTARPKPGSISPIAIMPTSNKTGSVPVIALSPISVPPRASLASSSSESLYTYPAGNIANRARVWANDHPGDAPAMLYLANQPMAEWYGGWNTNVQKDVATYVGAAQTVNQIPTLVAYNIPERDCGGFSAGGASNDTTYLSWIRSFANGIGSHKAFVILEPDAVANLDCLSMVDQVARLELIGKAVTIIRNTTNAKLYIDAGNTTWHSAVVMAQRLRQANIAQADGFSLNVSNFISTADNINFGTQLSEQLNNTHFIIDTSRNGNGPALDNQWCNPAGRALGSLPTFSTKNQLVDAFLWVKGPGGSDGNCGPAINGEVAPSAGVWWPAAALELMKNAGWYQLH